MSGAQPKQADGKSVISTEQTDIEDMCFVKDGEKQLLVVAGGNEGLSAYNTVRDALQWKIDGHLSGNEMVMKPMGVTTDGRGHLFIADSHNRRIQMFVAPDGQYLGYLLLDKTEIPRSRFVYYNFEEIFRFPWRIRWCEETSSLMCSSRSNRPKNWYLSYQS